MKPVIVAGIARILKKRKTEKESERVDLPGIRISGTRQSRTGLMENGMAQERTGFLMKELENT